MPLGWLPGAPGTVLEGQKATKWPPFACFEPSTFSVFKALGGLLGSVLAPLGLNLVPNWPPK